MGLEDERPRDMGTQPLAKLMDERGLQPTALVRASPVQITHKMVQRAIKGRRLTANTMAKIVQAYAAATGEEAHANELFDYEP